MNKKLADLLDTAAVAAIGIGGAILFFGAVAVFYAGIYHLLGHPQSLTP